MTLRSAFIDIITEPQDPRSSQFATWFETLFADNPLTDRALYSFKTTFTPLEYRTCWLAESYEITDPTTVTVKIRQGIKWQNKFPANGREFTADDVVYSFDRVLMTGSGYSPENPGPGSFVFPGQMPTIERVVKVDDYTVQFKLKTPNAMAIYEVVEPFIAPGFVSPEWDALTKAEKEDWHNVPGTGPFLLTDFVPNISITTTRNPDYWGYDERHPKNKLPYLDEIKVVCIPDEATATAALRTGRIDMMTDDRVYPSLATAESIAKLNPDIQQYTWPGAAYGVFFKYGGVGVKPFDDINVRKAMQLAIDIPTIAKTYYKGTVEGKPAGLLSPLVGADWALPYDQWPADLQAEYSYNPAKAKQLLADAGYPNGFEFEVLATPDDDRSLQLIIKDAFKNIGVTMNIESFDMITQRPMVLAGNYKYANWVSSSGQTSLPTTAIGSFWSKKGQDETGGGGGVSDPTYDALVDKYLAAANIDEAKAVFREADLYQLRQHWVAVVCPIAKPQLCQAWIKGWSGEHFWGMWGWFTRARYWVDPALKK
jgi:ABC-type transport system substrate-binding protein